MRTTVDLPSPLFRQAKARAAERGETLRELLTRAVEAEVGHRELHRTSPPARVKLPLIAHRGGRKIRLTSQDIARLEEEDDLLRHRRSVR